MKSLWPALSHGFRRKGYSLFEVLICLAVVGIMVSIALANLTQAKRDLVIETMNRRNAQAFATIALCAQVAGIDPVIEDNLPSTLQNIITGVTAPSGPFEGRTFRINGLTHEDIPGAATYLKLADGKLIYEGDKAVQ